MSTVPTITDDVRAATGPTDTRRRQWITGTIVAVILVAAGLWLFANRDGGPDAFPVLDTATVAEAEALAEFIEGYEATWDAGDIDAFAAYLADDGFEFIEPASHIRTKEGFVEFMRPFFAEGTQGDAIDRRVFSGDGEVVESYLGWGFGPFTADNPVVEVDLFTVKDDSITSLHAMYDPALTRSIYGIDPTDLVTAYASAWSSGDPDRLISLYSSDASRVEGLYGVELEGIDEITRHAELFFDRHPGATWRIVDPYIFTSGQLSGAVFTLTEPDGCEIGMAVLVEIDDTGLISAERIYHAIDTIQACNWQR